MSTGSSSYEREHRDNSCTCIRGDIKVSEVLCIYLGWHVLTFGARFMNGDA